MKFDETKLRDIYGSLHASDKARQEVFFMNQVNEKPRRLGKRVATVALVAVLAVALAVGVMAVSGVFTMNIREAEPEERFAGPEHVGQSGEKQAYYWEGAKLVFNFNGPTECSAIRFRPAYLPYNANQYFSFEDSEGWYTRISCEGSGSGGRGYQPCLIEVRYAPKFIDGGNLLLLYADDVSEIREETWNGYSIYQFISHRANGNFPDGSRDLDCSYYIMYQPELGHIITISSMEDNLSELEKIGQNLEIELTDGIIFSADWHEHNEFLDCGIG